MLQNIDTVIVHNFQNKLQIISQNLNLNSTITNRDIKIVPHGVRSFPVLSDKRKEDIRKNKGISDDLALILSFGFLQPHKGMEAVIETIAHLKARGRKCKGYIAGSTREDDPNSKVYSVMLKDYAKKLSVYDDIIFDYAYLTDSQISELIQISDLLILNYQSKYFESSGVASFAISHNTPIITSVAPAFIEFADCVWNASGVIQYHYPQS